mgnify:CR=1 FL=1
MISFENDYSTGAHPRILETLAATNLEPAPGYGSDRFCESAAARIRAACDDETADVFFLTGGTQTNAVVISALLAGHEGVIAADTGHIAVHEAGAIEATGHKVLTVPECDGKLRAADVEAYLETFYADASYTHMVFPGMVFIAHPSELGTLYSLAELEELSAAATTSRCTWTVRASPMAWPLPTPTSPWPTSRASPTPSTSAAPNAERSAARRSCSRAAACPGTSSPTPSSTAPCWPRACALFTDDLYGEVGRTAAAAADELRRILREAGCTFFRESPTNQQFVVLDNAQVEALAEGVRFSTWEKLGDGRTVIRLVTSWSTTPDDLAALKAALHEVL